MNIDFLSGKHVLLFVFTMLLVIFFIFPYTLSLVTIQWLLRISRYHDIVHLWVQKLKPFLDAYTGPYKISHRYWTGVLLIARVVLLVIFSLIRESNPSVNLLAIIIYSYSVAILCSMGLSIIIYQYPRGCIPWKPLPYFSCCPV